MNPPLLSVPCAPDSICHLEEAYKTTSVLLVLVYLVEPWTQEHKTSFYTTAYWFCPLISRRFCTASKPAFLPPAPVIGPKPPVVVFTQGLWRIFYGTGTTNTSGFNHLLILIFFFFPSITVVIFKGKENVKTAFSTVLFVFSALLVWSWNSSAQDGSDIFHATTE